MQGDLKLQFAASVSCIALLKYTILRSWVVMEEGTKWEDMLVFPAIVRE